jgi:hypothetical protein
MREPSRDREACGDPEWVAFRQIVVSVNLTSALS